MSFRFQENMRRQRENPETKRAGLKWDDEEDQKVLSMIKEGKSMEDIAKELFRSPASIKTRVVILTLNEIKKNPENPESLMKQYGITVEDIQKYSEKKKSTDEKKQNITLSMINAKNLNPTIKDLYELLKENLVVSNDIRSMLCKRDDIVCDKITNLSVSDKK